MPYIAAISPYLDGHARSIELSRIYALCFVFNQIFIINIRTLGLLIIFKYDPYMLSVHRCVRKGDA